MRISEVIRYHRKKENLTQEQIANYLNISAPAVNKWENGISYPDITLLSPLARVLKIDVNTLLAFNEELTDAEVKAFTKEVGEIASKDSFEKAFEKADEIIKQYPSCDELIYWISVVLRIHLLKPQIEEKEKYKRKIIAWLQLVSSGGREKTAAMAKLDLSAMYREEKDYKKAQELLDDVPEEGLDTVKKVQQAQLFESIGKINEAYGVYEENLKKNAQEAFMNLSFIINLLYKEKKFTEAEKYIERAKKAIEAFDLGAYHKYQLELSLAREKHDREKAIEMIINMVNEAGSMDEPINSELYRHIKLNIPKRWDDDRYKRAVKNLIKEDKTLDFVKDDPRIKFLLE